ncbi:GyrI-like domain-containing protein [Skermania piniformis]|uniref:GyrI-like domain-containing protein n=1 Tax=Skermania pinensis TaxID=39122 RepID=A0ABX8S7K8_9ACTN|nr:GyrI-like domain-containing protein [Skermania piniformis]QXQ13807.1 GyrI-like domain-containing protein [Skermania piniformis]
MNFKIVARREILVAGTVLRSPALAVEGPRRLKVTQAWERMFARTLPGPPATAYVDFAGELNSYMTHIVGYRCRTLGDLLPGDVLARLPAGRYAHFVCRGDELSVVVPELWRAVWDAEAEGRIVRGYTGDFERYPDVRTAEAFVALAGEREDE